MLKIYIKIFFIAIFVFILDQFSKTIILNGYRFDNDCFSLILIFNKGVAFSMLKSLDEYLKYIQLVLLLGVAIYLYINNKYLKDYFIGISIIMGAGFSNLLDRFIHEGVVDYAYWHCGFDFAVFNFADVMIDIGVVLILLKSYKIDKQSQK